jgi:hypothetical protein
VDGTLTASASSSLFSCDDRADETGLMRDSMTVPQSPRHEPCRQLMAIYRVARRVLSPRDELGMGCD